MKALTEEACCELEAKKEMMCVILHSVLLIAQILKLFFSFFLCFVDIVRKSERSKSFEYPRYPGGQLFYVTVKLL